MKILALLFLICLYFAVALIGCHSTTNQTGSGGGGGTTTTPPSNPTTPTTTAPLLQVSTNGKYLVDKNTGKPVFCTGDSPQFLPVQISNSDATTYFQDRQTRGFNCLWLYVADKVDQTNAPKNFYNQAPFDGPDFTNEDSAYWAQVDTTLQMANSYGMVAFVEPGFVGLVNGDGYLPSYQSASCATLTAYGNFLGSRYASYPNIVWALGGDWDPSNLPASQLNCLASGIRAKDPVHLMTLEACRSCSPANQSTMDAWNQSTAMQINWVYATYSLIQPSCASNYARAEALPAIAGEDWYENTHNMTSLNIREEGWWEELSGCTVGRMFGNDPLYCFDSNTAVSLCITGAWQNQLASPGSLSSQYEGQLMRSREFWLMAPDSSNKVLTGGIGSGTSISVAGCTTDGQTCIAYDPLGNAQPAQIAMSHFSGTVHGYWVNPTSCAVTDLGTLSNTGTYTFAPADGNDWVLVLDLNSAGLPAPCTGSFQ